MIKYRYDLRGYDGLFLFSVVFPDFETWKEKLNSVMFVNTIEDNEDEKKLYNLIYNKYKGHFYKYPEYGDIYSETAIYVERIYTAITTARELSKDLSKITGTNERTDYYKTDNTKGNVNNPEKVNDSYRTGTENTFTDNSELYLEARNKAVENSALLNMEVNKMNEMFMKETEEVISKNLYGK